VRRIIEVNYLFLEENFIKYSKFSAGACSLKNKNADLDNPNMYHSIDDLNGTKVEHLYDEIKQKEAGELIFY
jgi:hypothetical protein